MEDKQGRGKLARNAVSRYQWPMPREGVKVRQLATCRCCRYQQNAENENCRRCGKSLKDVRRDWYVFGSHVGKRKATRVGSEEAAQKVAKKIEAKLALGDFGILDKKPSVPAFKEVSRRWLDEISTTRRETTHDQPIQ